MIAHWLILNAVKQFQLELTGRTVLTEAASGNYCCTPLIAAAAGARVFAFGKDSKYGRYTDVRDSLLTMSQQLGLADRLTVVDHIPDVPLAKVDILTNTGFLRPINKPLLDQLSRNCIIPLMYEPWEFRPADIDLDYCRQRGIKVIGTNESDQRLKTMSYIGLTVLYFLLHEKLTPPNARVLLVGSAKFNDAILETLSSLHFDTTAYTTDQFPTEIDIASFNAIVLTEFVDRRLLLGPSSALIPLDKLAQHQVVIHIAGNTNTQGIKSKLYPSCPAPAQTMSYTTDFINPRAVVDLHAAGLAVADGAIRAREAGIADDQFANYLQSHYPALLFPEDLPSQ
ncbi:MAG: hypothetical protein KF752_20145 [Pirellulaceae bacterium]|nr:hypothetical protein [Pirellulaceae bacterium]